MKIYEVTTDESRQWFDKKAEAQEESKKSKVPMIDHEVGSTRSGFVKFLNKVASTAPTATRTVVRVTASKPPVPDDTYDDYGVNTKNSFNTQACDNQ